MYFNIKCIGKLPGPTNQFERSLVFETGEFERPKFDCTFPQYLITCFLTAVRLEVKNLESSVVVQELEFAINLAL